MMTRRMVLWFLLALPLAAADKDGRKAAEGPVVHVGGEVNKPGTFPFRNDTTVLGAVFLAGGVTKSGTLHRVKINRDGKTRSVDLTKEAGKLELVRPGDMIEVPRANLFGR